ncbi:MAG: hypothetical protein KatS3mg109_2076 [Pirellulaceae bacterium]|nr:MAG: hypothetical protein KatS3mg109_0381 [Pirellulaceae bacterium]GIW91644.1 MAG: hypothetical protein KatS3mg109_2076 [Pirellulaceae bacterium]
MSRFRDLGLILLAMVAGGTIAGAVQGTARELELAELRAEVRLLSDSLLSCRRARLHSQSPDVEQILRIAALVGVPDVVLLAVIEQETGTSGRYDVVGKHGEYGRAQIRYKIWRTFSPDCASGDPESQLRCAAQILRYCRDRYGNWRDAVACYNSTSDLSRAARYLASVERRIGRMVLGALE